jgi:hypothetical protein
MQTVILAIIVLLIVVVAMSVGVMMGRKPIKGSCGGVGAALGEKDYICPVCGDDPNKCENEQDNDPVKNQLSKVDELVIELTSKQRNKKN